MLGSDNELQLPGSPAITRGDKQRSTEHCAAKLPHLVVQVDSVHFQFMMFFIYGVFISTSSHRKSRSICK